MYAVPTPISHRLPVGFKSHDFEVGLINYVRPTDRAWVIGDTFDRFDKKYANGIICP